MNELVGTILGDGRYRIDEVMASGGQGTLFRGIHLRLQMPVAIKMLPPAYAEDLALRTRFEHEALRLAELRHPNIVVVHDYGYESGFCYIVSDYVQGRDLRTVIAQADGIIPFDRVLHYLEQVGSGLQYAHDQGIIHRDIKPGNILVDGATDRAFLCDFGLAQHENDDDSLSLSDTGVLGTPAYMSPEQCLNLHADHRTDIYSLALVVYEMLTGRHPLRGAHETSKTILEKQVNKEPPPPRSLNPKLGQEANDVLLKALAKAPSARYQSVKEFVDALRTAAPRPWLFRVMHIRKPVNSEMWVTLIYIMYVVLAAIGLFILSRLVPRLLNTTLMP